MTRARLAAALLATTLLAAAPAGAQTLRIGLQEDPDMLDPTLARTFVGRIVFASLCDKLVDIDPNLNFVPMLATSWTYADDGKALSFKLRDGVTFHDGTKLDGQAFKASIERHQTMKGSNRASEIRPVDRVEVVGPSEVVLHLKAPFSPLLAQLSDRAGMIMSPKAIAEADAPGGRPFAQAPVCAGPFRFAERVAQDRIVLDRYDGYWNKSAVRLDRVVFRPIPDQTVRLANLRSGDLDIIERAAPSDMAAIKGDPTLVLSTITSLGYQGITFNLANGPRSQTPIGQIAKLREAFELSIDRAIINEVALEGAHVIGNQPVAPSNPYYAASVPIPGRDVVKAKALMQEAGHPKVSFEMMIANNPEQQRIGEIIQAMAAEAGFEVKLNAMEFAAALDRQTKGDFEVFAVGWSGRTDPDGNIHTFTESKGSQNDGRYSNAQVDAALNRAREVAAVEERRKLYEQAARLYVGQDRPRVYIYHPNWIYGARKVVTGFVPYPDGLIRPFGIKVGG
jgi:peptide/nickel transport system substrate-binding protein